MPRGKVYVIDEFEKLKGHCRDRKKTQNETSLQISSSEYSTIFANKKKKIATKYLVKSMKSANIEEESENAKEIDELKNEEIDICIDNEQEGENTLLSPDPHLIVQETAREFASNIQSAENIEHVANKLTCKKVDIENIIRDKNINSKTLNRKFSIHEHIKLKNESGAFRYLSRYFGSGSSLRLSVGNEFPQTLTVSTGKRKNHRATGSLRPGMLIFINPDFAGEETCTLSVSGVLPGSYEERHLAGVAVTFSTTFWSNGDTNGLELTTRKNVTGLHLSTFGGVVPSKEGHHRLKSMPGWNGRLPMWVPFNECECTVTEGKISRTSNNNQEELEGASLSFPRLSAHDSPKNSTYNFQNTFGERLDTSSPTFPISFAEASPYDTKCVIPSFGPNSSPTKSRFDGTVVYLTAYQCGSLEIALDKLSELSRKFQSKIVGGITLHGNMPALNLACLHGNVLAAKKLLKMGADPNRVAPSTLATPLHDAVMGGHHDVMALLYEYGAKQTYCDSHGMTPLHLCCVNNDVAGARFLLQQKDAKAVLSKCDRKGRTPLASCSRRHIKEIISRECKKHGVKPKRSSAWWMNLTGGNAPPPSARQKSTARDFMKLAQKVGSDNKSARVNTEFA